MSVNKRHLFITLLVGLGLIVVQDFETPAALDSISISPLLGSTRHNSSDYFLSQKHRFTEQAPKFPGDPLDDSNLGLGPYSRSLLKDYKKLIMSNKPLLEHMLSGHRVLAIGQNRMQLIANVWFLTLGYCTNLNGSCP